MRKDYKYIGILVTCMAVFVFLELVTPKPINWTITLASADKNPFGAYLLNERIGDLFPEKTRSNLTLYELQDSSYQNFFILTRNFALPDEDLNVLLEKVNQGSNAFIASSYFSGKFTDTLKVDTEDYLFQGNLFENLNEEDTAGLYFTNPKLNQTQYFFQRNNTQYYFSRFDSSRTTILGMNDLEKPTLLKINWGKGTIILSSTPLAFTNNYLVYQDNYEYVSKALSYLPTQAIHWTEYYQLGRMEARTPLRFVLSNESLKWAYYLTLFALALFIIFESKRKQRVIPVVAPPRNDTLDFVGTISNLYYQNKAHRSIALKKINFFLEQLRQHHYISIKESDPDFYNKVAQKTGNTIEDVTGLFEMINKIKASNKINEEVLIELSDRIEKFNTN